MGEILSCAHPSYDFCTNLERAISAQFYGQIQVQLAKVLQFSRVSASFPFLSITERRKEQERDWLVMREQVPSFQKAKEKPNIHLVRPAWLAEYTQWLIMHVGVQPNGVMPGNEIYGLPNER